MSLVSFYRYNLLKIISTLNLYIILEICRNLCYNFRNNFRRNFNMENFEKTFKLPSNGLFGGPKEVTLRAMTTKEEKILLTTRDMSVFDRLIKSCCVEPKDLDTSLLHENDIMFLVFALRSITFGDTYTQTTVCPECGFKQDVEISISEMETNILDIDEVDEKLVCTLPVNGDTLQLKLLSTGDINRIDRLVKNRASKGKVQDPDSYNFTLKLMETIVSKNGEDFVDQDAKRHYVDTLNMRDLIVIQNTLSSIEFGLDNTVYRTCNKCNEEMEVAGVICPEFFRPTK